MIVINTIEELKPFSKFISKLKGRIEAAKVQIAFLDENGKLDDVTINIDCDIKNALSTSEEFDVLLENDKAVYYDCEMIAKSVYLNGFLNIDTLKCENLISTKTLQADFLTVKDNIKANVLDCKDVFCERLECEELKCEDMSVVYAKIGHLEIHKTEPKIGDDEILRCKFDNVEFHGLTFSSDIDLSGWKEEKYGFWHDIS